ncbi:glycoside hydrolase family 16 protein [Rubrivirga marina]|uniref:GH16 domain-containing protein n=1 Tax=Rubrivirga marina TaxID=1196024 RepID=A0A271IY32_9BACT|nr:glycoside hydrolase family 16 protein [Rubrivirga marina]PAP75615.1 hypothetical protein BSZ37_03780 [Rubrivirga marina]
MRPLLLAALALAALPASAQAPADTLFFDGFDGDALDRSKWFVRVTGESFGVVNDEQQAYVDSTSTIDLLPAAEGAEGGVLRLRANYRPGTETRDGTFDFTSGRIDTSERFTFTRGTAAARMKLPAGTGFWPAFWALGEGRWPDTGEIDIMESVGETDWTGVALHGPGYSGETPLVNKAFFPEGEGSDGWHVYSVDWTDDALLFRLDGRLIYRTTRPMVEHYGRWAFDNPKYLILNLALGGAYPVKTNGVTEPYPGLPQPTVDLIRDGRGEVLVDWVLVTAP